MKVFNTGGTIRLNNIESFEKVEIGSLLFSISLKTFLHHSMN